MSAKTVPAAAIVTKQDPVAAPPAEPIAVPGQQDRDHCGSCQQRGEHAPDLRSGEAAAGERTRRSERRRARRRPLGRLNRDQSFRVRAQAEHRLARRVHGCAAPPGTEDVHAMRDGIDRQGVGACLRLGHPTLRQVSIGREGCRPRRARRPQRRAAEARRRARRHRGRPAAVVTGARSQCRDREQSGSRRPRHTGAWRRPARDRADRRSEPRMPWRSRPVRSRRSRSRRGRECSRRRPAAPRRRPPSEAVPAAAARRPPRGRSTSIDRGSAVLAERFAEVEAVQAPRGAVVGEAVRVRADRDSAEEPLVRAPKDADAGGNPGPMVNRRSCSTRRSGRRRRRAGPAATAGAAGRRSRRPRPDPRRCWRRRCGAPACRRLRGRSPHPGRRQRDEPDRFERHQPTLPLSTSWRHQA